jgi:hypothetical protein
MTLVRNLLRTVSRLVCGLTNDLSMKQLTYSFCSKSNFLVISFAQSFPCLQSNWMAQSHSYSVNTQAEIGWHKHSRAILKVRAFPMTSFQQDWKWRNNLKIHHTLLLERSFSFNSFLYFSRLKFKSLQTGGLAFLWTYIKFKKGKQGDEPRRRHTGRNQKRFLLIFVEWDFCWLLLTFLIENRYHHLYLFTKVNIKQNENWYSCIYNPTKAQAHHKASMKNWSYFTKKKNLSIKTRINLQWSSFFLVFA